MRGPEAKDLYGFSYLNSCKKDVVHLGTTGILKCVEILHIQQDRGPLKDVSTITSCLHSSQSGRPSAKETLWVQLE